MENDQKLYDFYLAGPFFTDDQINMQEKIEMLMSISNKKCFSPRLDAGTLPENATKKDMLDVFNADLRAIDNCKSLFANVSFRDTGTSVEIGYALAKKIPVILYWNENIHDTDHVNLMIALACEGKVINNWLELQKYLDTNELPDNNFQFNVD